MPSPLLSRQFVEQTAVSVKNGAIRLARRAIADLKRMAKALWGATPVAMKTAGTAISLAGAGLSTYATIQVVRAPAIANYSVLKACNDAMRVKQPCTQAGATERAKSIHAQKHLGMFAGGGVVMAVGAGVFSLGGRRKK